MKKEGAIFRVPDSYTLDVALTADGKLLARAGTDKTVDLWDVASGKKLHTLKGHTAPLLRVAFSPDGKTLASITGSWLPDDVLGEVKLWDVATGKERVSLKGHPTRMLSLAFSPDGKTLASAAGTVKLWDVATGKEKLELKRRLRLVPGFLAGRQDPGDGVGRWTHGFYAQFGDPLGCGHREGEGNPSGTRELHYMGRIRAGRQDAGLGELWDLRERKSVARSRFLARSSCGTLPRPRSGRRSPSER